ncbi:uncharacterized protein TNCT_125971 [Trichonephila clavata]|uniref:AAA+ ATPase domain-containing protein n=1 Tax=Trichonephila clavata TaxID=2740835 RepID=A0A8X6FDR9_TRICU|nr:uncharacterized protein TNCT_125971 [Trichonephila clavata]
MSHSWELPVYHVGFDKHVESLTPSQQTFPFLVHEWLLNRQHAVILVAGGPGSGKTFTVTSCLDRISVPQLRMAPTARVAQRIGGQTIHSALKLGWTPGSVLYTLEKQLQHETDEAVCLEKSAVLVDTFDCPQMPDIVVVDEIGMVSFWLAHCIIQYFFRRPKPILFVAMGDPNQLRPVKTNHNVFIVSLDIPIIRIDLKESKRFSPEYESIIQQLRYYVDTNDETGLFTYICGTFPIVEHIDTTVLQKCTRALAYLKSTVEAYNNFYLKRLIQGPRIRLWTRTKEGMGTTYVDVKVGCHIFIIQNGVSLASNGTPLLFENYNAEQDCIECMDPVKKVMIQVQRNLKGEFPIVVGFAGTIHKFQGDTMDDDAIAMNFNGSRDLNLVYTALSRVKSINQIVALQL